jgi:hypothetical protein
MYAKEHSGYRIRASAPPGGAFCTVSRRLRPYRTSQYLPEPAPLSPVRGYSEATFARALTRRKGADGRDGRAGTVAAGTTYSPPLSPGTTAPLVWWVDAYRAGERGLIPPDQAPADRGARRRCCRWRAPACRSLASICDRPDRTSAVPALGGPAMRWLRRISGIAWLFSWYTIYREIFVWHHMTKSLRFNPPPPLPGAHTQPKPGLPLIAVRLGSVAAPLVFVTAAMVERARRRSDAAACQTTD